MKKSITFILVLVVSLTSCTPSLFNGSRTGNNNEFLMDFTKLNMTDKQLLSLEQGDIINVEIVVDSGELIIKIESYDAQLLIFTGEFKGGNTYTEQLTISESGAYEFSVTGIKAKGSVSFIKQTKDDKGFA